VSLLNQRRRSESMTVLRHAGGQPSPPTPDRDTVTVTGPGRRAVCVTLLAGDGPGRFVGEYRRTARRPGRAYQWTTPTRFSDFRAVPRPGGPGKAANEHVPITPYRPRDQQARPENGFRALCGRKWTKVFRTFPAGWFIGMVVRGLVPAWGWDASSPIGRQ